MRVPCFECALRRSQAFKPIGENELAFVNGVGRGWTKRDLVRWLVGAYRTAAYPLPGFERLACVPNMTEVLPEAYELVEHGLLSEDDFRDFMFENAVRFWGEVNPDFFKGTVVEKQAAEVLARPTR